MSGTPEVSVITANYNGARYLTAAIQSIERQSLSSWELIIVDDASTDESVAIAKAAADDDPRIKIIAENANRGPAAARNRALDLATGRWIAIFDSDDLMRPNRLERLVRRAADDDAAIIADNLLVFSDSAPGKPFLNKELGETSRWIDFPTFVAAGCLYARYPDLGYLKPMIRGDIVRALGLRYDESLRIGEDYDFVARLMARDHLLRLQPEPLYLYRKHDNSISHRLRAEDIAALLAAADQFPTRVPALSPAAVRALKCRQRSLRSLSAYEATIAALKRRDFPTAAEQILMRPHMWPLLTQPLTARLRRIMTAIPSPRRNTPKFSSMTELEALLLGISSTQVPGGSR